MALMHMRPAGMHAAAAACHCSDMHCGTSQEAQIEKGSSASSAFHAERLAEDERGCAPGSHGDRQPAANARTIGGNLVKAGCVQVHRGDEGGQGSLGRARCGVVVHIAVQQVDVKVLPAHAGAAHILRGRTHTAGNSTTRQEHVKDGQGGRQSLSERLRKPRVCRPSAARLTSNKHTTYLHCRRVLRIPLGTI